LAFLREAIAPYGILIRVMRGLPTFRHRAVQSALWMQPKLYAERITFLNSRILTATNWFGKSVAKADYHALVLAWGVTIREVLGPFPGHHIPGPFFLPGGVRAKKPCRSVGHGTFLPAKKLAIQAPKSRPATPDPLFLLYCGLDWHKRAETGAGWGLIEVMRFPRQRNTR